MGSMNFYFRFCVFRFAQRSIEQLQKLLTHLLTHSLTHACIHNIHIYIMMDNDLWRTTYMDG